MNETNFIAFKINIEKTKSIYVSVYYTNHNGVAKLIGNVAITKLNKKWTASLKETLSVIATTHVHHNY